MAARTIDDYFVQEFNRAKNYAPKNLRNIMDVPVPEWANDPKGLKEKVFEVRGVDNLLFEPLNDTTVRYIPGKEPKRRKLNRVGKFEGEFERVPTPTGSLPVFSDVMLPIPFGYNGTEHPGYNSADKYSQGYMYLLPKKVLYPVNFCALTISTKRVQSFNSASVRLADFSLLYVSVVPYRPWVNYTQTRILKVKGSTDFAEEISEIYNLWLAQGYVLDLSMFVVENINLAFQEIVSELPPYIRSSEEPLNPQTDSLDSTDFADLPDDPATSTPESESTEPDGWA